MEIPCPGLKTREKNKKTHPAIAAGVEKKRRRTAAQMERVRDDETTSRALAKLEDEKAVRRLAALEDKQREDDILYVKSANHPADHPVRSSQAIATAVTGAASGGAGDNSGSGDDSNRYSTSGDDSSEESTSEPDASEEDVPEKKKKKQKRASTSRGDVLGARRTLDGSGTPAVTVADNNPKKRKAKGSDAEEKPKKKKTKVATKKSGLSKSKSGGPQVPHADDDSMVLPGGPALDNDAEEHVERPKTGKKKKGVPTESLITIRPAPPRPLTAKETVPLPRTKLTVKHVQDKVDQVYGPDKHEVTAEGPWFGLVGYRLNSWRHAIGAQALKAINETENEDNEPGEDDEPGDDGLATGDDGGSIPSAAVPPAAGVEALAADVAVAAKIAAKPLKFKLDTPEGIAAFTWGNGVDKKGFLQSYLIVYTYAYHLSCLATIPGGYTRLKAPAIGALLMSAQATQRALQLWRTGEYVNAQKTADSFSTDHWADHIINRGPGHRPKQVRRATKFLSSVQKWTEDQWKEVTAAAQEYVELPSRKRAQTSSRSGSEAGDNAMLSDDGEVIVVSD
ncbi:hypothetical protein B0H13DRAFT_2537196 [Mycena leptocephala]|nr:hypothetical protein B0H13DRAFT_2537196 [Mycena leptocephala]